MRLKVPIKRNIGINRVLFCQKWIDFDLSIGLRSSISCPGLLSRRQWPTGRPSCGLSMFDFGNCCKVLGHKTITTGCGSINYTQRWHWRPKLPTRTDRQCRFKKIFRPIAGTFFFNRMGGVNLTWDMILRNQKTSPSDFYVNCRWNLGDV